MTKTKITRESLLEKYKNKLLSGEPQFGSLCRIDDDRIWFYNDSTKGHHDIELECMIDSDSLFPEAEVYSLPEETKLNLIDNWLASRVVLTFDEMMQKIPKDELFIVRDESYFSFGEEAPIVYKFQEAYLDKSKLAEYAEKVKYISRPSQGCYVIDRSNDRMSIGVSIDSDELVFIDPQNHVYSTKFVYGLKHLCINSASFNPEDDLKISGEVVDFLTPYDGFSVYRKLF